MAGWYRVVKTIKGHSYVYEQRTWRDGKHVRTQSRYIGKAGVAGSSSSSSDRAVQARLTDITAATKRASSVREVSERFLDVLGEGDIEGIYLVGSRAKGKAGATSDWDFIVVGKGFDNIEAEKLA